MSSDPEGEAPPTSYVSTGRLPGDGCGGCAVRASHDRFRSNTDGRNSDVYPSLGVMPSELLASVSSGPTGHGMRPATRTVISP